MVRLIDAATLQKQPDLSGLFEPLKINGLTLPNRIVMAPMAHQNSVGGVHRPGMARFYARRAAGGSHPERRDGGAASRRPLGHVVLALPRRCGA